MTASRPRIVPNVANRFFWEGAGSGALMVLRCEVCGFRAHPQSRPLSALRGARIGAGAVERPRHGLQFHHRSAGPFHPGFADDLPYVLALVALPEQTGLRMSLQGDQLGAGGGAHRP